MTRWRSASRRSCPRRSARTSTCPARSSRRSASWRRSSRTGFVRYYYLDWDKRQAEFKPGVMIDLQPFPGIIGVGPDPNEPKEKAGPPIRDAKGRTSTLRPWKNGSNLDINELQEGSTLYLPVFLKGALIWTGDSHCRQGNGEVNLTGLECASREIVLQSIVRKDMKLEWPRAETATHFIMMGFDEDLNEAMKIATRETVSFLAGQTDGADEPRRGLRADVDGGRLPSEPGGRHPQGRALHGAEVDLRQEVAVLHRACAAALALVLVAAAGPARGAGGPLSIVTTTTDLKALVEAVGGDRVAVESLAPPLVDPHAVEVKPGQLGASPGRGVARPRRPRSRAVAAPRAGHGRRRRPHAGRAARSRRLARRGAAQTETPRLRDDRATPHLHGFGNPHYWLDPENARPITAAIQGALARLSPSDRERFEDNRRRFLERLGTGLARWRAALAPWRDARLVAMHDTWPYFAARFGLTIAATVEPTPGVPPSPARARRARRADARGRRARAGGRAVRQRRAGAPGGRQERRPGGHAGALGRGDAAAGDYVALFDLNVRRLADARLRRAEPGVLGPAGAAAAGLPDPHRHPRLSRPARARARRDLRGPGARPGRRARPHPGPPGRPPAAERRGVVVRAGVRGRRGPALRASRACAARRIPRRRSSGSSTRYRRRSPCWSWTEHRRAPSTSSSCWWARSSR